MNRIRSWFHLHPGEGSRALGIALLGWLWAFATTLGWKNGDALFLVHVGADALPTLYAFTAGAMLALASLMLWAVRRFDIHRIFLTILAAATLFYTGILLLPTQHAAFYYILRLGGFAFFSLCFTSFWTFIDQYFHLQDAKRLFGLFTSFVFAGIATTGLVMHSGWFSFPLIIVIILTLLVSAGFNIVHIVKTNTPVHDEGEEIGEKVALKTLLKGILSSNFTLLLMLSNFLIYLISILGEYHYLSAFENYFGPHTDSLTGFLGKCIVAVSLSNLLFGLFAYSRLVRRFGVGSLVFITPSILLITFLGWPWSAGLFFPVMAFFVAEGTTYVIDDSNFNLLLNGVPSKFKVSIRICIESFFEPLSTLICALLLTIAPFAATGIGLAFSLAALLVGLLLRYRYPKAIVQNLMNNALHFDRPLEVWLKKLSSKERKKETKKCLNMLCEGTPDEQDMAIDLLFALNVPLSKWLPAVDGASIIAKKHLIRKIAKSNISLIIDHLENWSEQHPPLRHTISLILASQGSVDTEKARANLSHPDLFRRGAAIAQLRSSCDELPPTQLAENRSLAAQHLTNLLSEDTASISLALDILHVTPTAEDIPLLLSFLDHPHSEIRRKAIATLAEMSLPPSCADKLFDAWQRSRDPGLRTACLQTLGKFKDSTLIRKMILGAEHVPPTEQRLVKKIIASIGLRGVPSLLSITKDHQIADRCRLLAGCILGTIALPQLRANLSTVLEQEIARAFFYLYHYHTLSKHYPEEDLHLLLETLHSGFYSALDFIIQLLAAAGEVEDSATVSRALRWGTPKVRGQAVETLERTCETAIFRLLQPLVDDRPLETRLDAYLQRGGRISSLTEVLDELSYSADLGDQMVATTLLRERNSPNWKEILLRQMTKNVELFHHFAYELLEA